MAVMRPYS